MNVRRELEALVGTLKRRLDAAGDDLGDTRKRGVLDIIDRLLKAAELLGKVTGEIAASNINVNVQLTAILAEVGCTSLDDVKARVQRLAALESMPEAVAIQHCEDFLLRAYRDRPELLERSKLGATRRALPAAGANIPEAEITP